MSLIVVTGYVILAFCFTSRGVATDTITARQPLRGNETAVSAQGKFELGLFTPASSGRFYVGVWYKNVPGQTVIWVGNRVSPLSSAAFAELRVSPDDGNLELIGLAGPSATTPGVVWSSNLSSPSPGTSNTVVIRDNGNLVLVDGGNVLWQSFDHPTDTLVPEAWLGENKITGEYQTLTSWRNSEDPAPGMFSDTVDRNGSSEFFYMWNHSRQYWRSGVWTGRFFARLPESTKNVLFNQTYVETAAYRRVTSVLYNKDTITRLVLELTGQTKQYIWVPASRSWQFFWAAPTVQCEVYALCGAFGVCDQRSQPPCQCPPGFAPAAERNWTLGDWSGGCRRHSSLMCARNTSTDGFLLLPDVQLPDDSLAAGVQSRSACEATCLSNCSCQPYSFSGNGGCAVWHSEFLNLQKLYADSGISSSDLYLRLSESGLRDLRGGKEKKGRRLWFALGIALGCAAALSTSALLVWISRRRRLAGMANEKGSSLAVYSFGNLRAATNNFSERLGGGGFGSVYRGVLKKEDTQVAVKKMEGLRQGDKQFRTEVNTLGRIQHINLVRLLGFCSSGNDKLLVYEYVPNGSLDGYIFGGGISSCLSWRHRYRIMVGVARGLVYLHDSCHECIIHCDIKPENILLDKDMSPKIADFGMAKLVGREFSRALTTTRGTIGYLAPEWISGLPISAKADVYSFGMMLFEVISGRRNSEGSSSGATSSNAGDDAEAVRRESMFFPMWVLEKVAAGEVGAVADRRLHGDLREEELERACRTACWCIQDEEDDRPTMAEVVHALEGVVPVQVPPMPRTLQYLLTLV